MRMAALVITPEIEAAAQQLAVATGTTPTEAVAVALRKQVQVLATAQPRSALPEERKARLQVAYQIVRRLQALPWDKTISADKALGYDEHGLPCA